MHLTISTGAGLSTAVQRFTFYANDTIFSRSALRPDGELDGLFGSWVGDSETLLGEAVDATRYRSATQLELRADGSATYRSGDQDNPGDTFMIDYELSDSRITFLETVIEPLLIVDGRALVRDDQLWTRVR